MKFKKEKPKKISLFVDNGAASLSLFFDRAKKAGECIESDVGDATAWLDSSGQLAQITLDIVDPSKYDEIVAFGNLQFNIHIRKEKVSIDVSDIDAA